MKEAIPDEIKTWLDNSFQPNTGKVYQRTWKGFYDWLQVSGPLDMRGLTPMELVQMQKGLNKAFLLDEVLLPQKKVILYAVLDYVCHGDNAKWRSSYKAKIHSSVRSFFVYYLEKEGFPSLNGGERGRLKGSPRTRKNLKIETLKAIIDNSNPMYKAVWSSMLASGMGIGELVKWSGQGMDVLREAMANPIRVDGEDVIEIRLQARKHNVDKDFYVCVGGSALGYLKAYLKHREDMEARFASADMRDERARYYRKIGKEAPPLPSKFSDVIFVNNRYMPLTRKAAQFYWISQLKQLKLWKGKGRRTDRTNMNIHQIRSVFRTRGQKSDADKDILEYFLGHNIDSLGYNQIENDEEYRRAQYLKALPWVDIDKIEIERQSGESEAQKLRIEELENKLGETRDQFRDQVAELQEAMNTWKPGIRTIMSAKKYPAWIYVEYDGHEYVVLSRDEHKAILLGSIEGNIEFMKKTEGKWVIGDNMLYVTLRQMIHRHKPESFGVAAEEVKTLE